MQDMTQDDGSSQSIPQIPDDIVADIVDRLHRDKATLSSCALVASSWSHHARRNLFRRIIIQSQRTDPHIENFLDFVNSHPEVAPFVKEL